MTLEAHRRIAPVLLHLPATEPGVVCRSPLGDAAVSCVRASSATYLDAAGVLRTALANQPRVGADGLMSEPARTNLLLNNQTLAGWAQSRVDLSAADGPGGVGTATRLTDNDPGVTGSRMLLLSNVAHTEAVHARSVYVRAVGGGIDGLRIARTAATVHHVNFNLATGATTTSGAVTASGVEQVVGLPGWHRCWYVATDDALSSHFAIYLLKGGVTTFVGTGTEALDVYLPQMELGPYATSAIPTAGTAVQRLADALTVANPLVDGTRWAISVEAKILGAWTGAGSQFARFLWTLGASGAANSARIYLSATDLSLSVFDAAGLERRVTASVAAWLADSSHRIVAGYDGASPFLVLDGASAGVLSQAGTGLIATMPATITLGSAPAATPNREFGGSLKNLKAARTSDLARAGL